MNNKADCLKCKNFIGYSDRYFASGDRTNPYFECKVYNLCVPWVIKDVKVNGCREFKLMWLQNIETGEKINV